jgi:protein KTI12
MATRDSVGNQPKANQANIELFFLLNVRETNSSYACRYSRSHDIRFLFTNLPSQLIIISGYPTSGKTYRAKQLHSYFLQKISSSAPSSPSSGLRVHLISDHSLAIQRSVYNLESKDAHERSNNASEKDARATIYAAVKRVLSGKDVVILDGANYIKGWRYQLYCEAKAVRTTHAVVHVGTPVSRAREINEERLAARDRVSGDNVPEEEKPYETENWENLVFRYEEPNAMARWDSPLFTIPWDDAEPSCDAIWDAVIGSETEGGKRVVRPHQATVPKKVSGEDYLYELDRCTQVILNRILEWSKDHPGEGGGEVSVGEDSEELAVELPANPVGLPALQRLRRQFISLNRQNAVPVQSIRGSFVGYLNDSFQAALA